MPGSWIAMPGEAEGAAQAAERGGAPTGHLILVSLHFHPEPIGSAPPVSDFAAFAAEKGVAVTVFAGLPHYPSRQVAAGYRRNAGAPERWRGVALRRVRHQVGARADVLGRLVTEGSFALRLALGWLRHGVPRGALVSVSPSLLSVLATGVAAAVLARPHTVIVHDVYSGLAAMTPSGATAPTGPSAVFRWLLRRFERMVLNRADRLIVVSPAMARALRQMGVRTPTLVAPPHSDETRLHPRPEPSGPPSVLYSGAMGAKQGLETVLEAAAVLQREPAGQHLTFVMRGAGDGATALKAQAARLGLRHMRFEPLATADRLNSALSEGHVHLVPQRSEGASFALPSKVLAAMATGRPFVATAQPHTDLHQLASESGGGLVVPPDDPHALAMAIARLAGDPAMRAAMGASGRRYLEHHLSRDAICQRLLDAVMTGGPAYDDEPQPLSIDPAGEQDEDGAPQDGQIAR